MPRGVSLNRSIPARAGEPCTFRRCPSPRPVYPRASGGAVFIGAVGLDGLGLSPRERGSLASAVYRLPTNGSIPARAGEPSNRCRVVPAPPVYPRASGGAASATRSASSWTGLSPRERGSPFAAGCRSTKPRSIPARAGEPPRSSAGAIRPMVYPRASGGARGIVASGTARRGLSPRERGSHVPVGVWPTGGGSIPARAGEPAWMPAFKMPDRGLSPRERGSPAPFMRASV